MRSTCSAGENEEEEEERGNEDEGGEEEASFSLAAAILKEDKIGGKNDREASGREDVKEDAEVDFPWWSSSPPPLSFSFFSIFPLVERGCTPPGIEAGKGLVSASLEEGGRKYRGTYQPNAGQGMSAGSTVIHRSLCGELAATEEGMADMSEFFFFFFRECVCVCLRAWRFHFF